MEVKDTTTIFLLFNALQTLFHTTIKVVIFKNSNCYFLGDPDGDDILEESENRQSSELYKVSTKYIFFMRYI